MSNNNKKDVFLISTSLIAVLATVAGLAFFPQQAETTANMLFELASRTFGTSVQVFVFCCALVVLYIAFSKYGNIRLGNGKAEYPDGHLGVHVYLRGHGLVDPVLGRDGVGVLLPDARSEHCRRLARSAGLQRQLFVLPLGDQCLVVVRLVVSGDGVSLPCAQKERPEPVFGHRSRHRFQGPRASRADRRPGVFADHVWRPDRIPGAHRLHPDPRPVGADRHAGYLHHPN
jgi:hypothetical protein